MNIPLVQQPPLEPEDVEAAIAVLRSGRVTQGEKVAEFEAAFATYHGGGHAVFCNSGSSANLLALTVLTGHTYDARAILRAGDEVLVPAVTWPTTVWPIVQTGLVPVLADVDPETLNVARSALAGGIAGVSVVHVLGNPSPIPASGLFLEDCCEALGAEVGGRKVGTFGRISTFSFYISHHITTIEGGMVLCQDRHDADRLRMIRSHGWTRALPEGARKERELDFPGIDPRFLFVEVGYNLRGDDVRAAIGLCQLKRLEANVARRRAIYQRWCSVTDGHPGLFQPVKFSHGASPFAFPLVLREGVPRRTFTQYLESKGIETRPLVAGNLARQPAMQWVKHRVAGVENKHGTFDLPGADVLHDRGLYIGLHPSLTDDQVGYFEDALTGFKP